MLQHSWASFLQASQWSSQKLCSRHTPTPGPPASRAMGPPQATTPLGPPPRAPPLPASPAVHPHRRPLGITPSARQAYPAFQAPPPTTLSVHQWPRGLLGWGRPQCRAPILLGQRPARLESCLQAGPSALRMRRCSPRDAAAGTARWVLWGWGLRAELRTCATGRGRGKGER